MNKEIELKPCPFCGGKADYDICTHDDRYDFNAVKISCNNCDAEISEDYEEVMYRQEARDTMATRWNTRPIEAQLQTENARLRSALEDIADYEGWDWREIPHAWKWCKEFVARAKAALQHNEVTK